MKTLFLSLTVLLATVNSNAQSAEDSVKTTINNLFAAMKNADQSLFKTVFSDNAILQTITRDKEGKTIVTSESVQEFGDFIGKVKKDSADERISFETIKIDGPLAIVWTPYNFYFNGKFSHCGVNSFQLVRINGEWKIQYIIDTRRRAGCKP
jgi:exopolysaccharide biosynthesis protein